MDRKPSRPSHSILKSLRNRGALWPGFQESDSLPENPETDWILIDLNSYFASCEQEVNPKTRGKPMGIVPVMADTTSCIALSIEAKRLGITMGMTVGEIKRKIPGFIFCPANHELYVEKHHLIKEAIESCIPIHTTLSIDEFSCKLTGSQRKIDEAIKLSLQMKRAIEKKAGNCLKSSVGLGPNSFLAKVASDIEKPDGLTIIHKDRIREALTPLPLRHLPGIGRKMEERLRSFGVETMKALLDSSKAELKLFWGGIVGEKFHDWIRGISSYEPSTQTRSIGHQHVLAPKERNIDRAERVCQKLLERAAVRMRKEGYFTKRVTVSVRFQGPRSDPSFYFELSRKVDETQDSLIFIQTLKEMWREVPRDKKPLRVGIVLSDLVPESQHQFSLFENPKREKLSHTIDQINAFYGKKAIGFANALETSGATEVKIAFTRVPDLDEF